MSPNILPSPWSVLCLGGTAFCYPDIQLPSMMNQESHGECHLSRAPSELGRPYLQGIQCHRGWQSVGDIICAVYSATTLDCFAHSDVFMNLAVLAVSHRLYWLDIFVSGLRNVNVTNHSYIVCFAHCLPILLCWQSRLDCIDWTYLCLAYGMLM